MICESVVVILFVFFNGELFKFLNVCRVFCVYEIVRFFVRVLLARVVVFNVFWCLICMILFVYLSVVFVRFMCVLLLCLFWFEFVMNVCKFFSVCVYSVNFFLVVLVCEMCLDVVCSLCLKVLSVGEVIVVDVLFDVFFLCCVCGGMYLLVIVSVLMSVFLMIELRNEWVNVVFVVVCCCWKVCGMKIVVCVLGIDGYLV